MTTSTTRTTAKAPPRRTYTRGRRHGTVSCASTGCRDPRCRTTINRYDKERRVRSEQGTWQPFADAGPVRAHINTLLDTGTSLRAIADLAGVQRETLRRVLRPDTARLYRVTAERLLAVTAPTDPLTAARAETDVDATGTRRRIQALIALGWTRRALAEHLGRTPAQVGILTRARLVHARTATDVRTLYDRLSMTSGPHDQARAEAAARGWTPPLAWDEGTLDDPTAEPDPGATPTPAKRAAHTAHEARHLLAAGTSRHETAERLGIGLAHLRKLVPTSETP
ncbi:hypothetical protein [Embleya sp. NPDC050493]|uniref:hypothetical protein n=1 Tax=Embleya sp. NPDC050493 TaxID=3363989 RepID=UPI0037BCC1E8